MELDEKVALVSPKKEVKNKYLYFNDGIRKTDYIIAYRDDSKEHDNVKERRRVFIENLKIQGLRIECVDKKGKQVKFVIY